MDSEFKSLLESLAGESDFPEWDGGLLKKIGSGHTWEVAELEEVHPGRDSSSAFLLGKLLGTIDEKQGTEILNAIGSLQVTEKDSERFGAFRWYREETAPIDTNAAFFTLLPLVVIRLYEPELLGSDEINVMDRMLSSSYFWFSHECENPILYYTNKIISDGAMLTAIGRITGNQKTMDEAVVFLEKWLDYTESRGFGWGENMSPGYNGVTIQAFTVIRKCLGKCNISERFEKIEKDILETFRFHNGYEFVPAIRSYNVTGKPKPWNIINNIAGVPGFGLADSFVSRDPISVANLAKAMVIYGDRLYLDNEDYTGKELSNPRSLPAVKTTHIMDDAKAYSWLGKNGGLGTIDKFPVIEGSYQHKTWGLGWQCFPVSAVVYDEQVSFLRFNVDDGDRCRHHPHKDKHSCFLDPALFSENHYPDVTTACCQKDNTAVVVRSISRLGNKAALVSDSFDVLGFNGKVIKISSGGRQWTVLSYDDAAICISPLLGYRHGISEAEQGIISIEKDGKNIRLVQTLYEGELKTLFDERISAGWVIHFIDRGMEEGELKDYLLNISVRDKCRPDGLVPRQPQWNIQETDVWIDGEEVINFIHDPYCN